MKIPLPWRRKSNPAVHHQLSSSPPNLSLISLPTTTSSSSSSSSPSPRAPTSPRSPAFLTTPTILHTRQHGPLARSPRQHHPPPQLYRSNEDTDSRSASLYLSSTTDTTTTYTDLYASTATYTVAGEEEELADPADDFIANGLLPCSPRWLADHADDSVRQHRANAQMGALAALRGGRFLTAVDS